MCLNIIILRVSAKMIIKVYIFGMCMSRRTFWYVIHANRMMLKILPHLTFGWPFANISSTMPPTHKKLYIFVILTSQGVIWYTSNHVLRVFEIWPQIHSSVTPIRKGENHSKFCQNVAWPLNTSNLPKTHFRRNVT